MRKNFEEIFSTIEIDQATDRYHITVPEEIMNEFGWYEDTEVTVKTDGDELIITEHQD